jgi:hypothetical protein
MNTQYPINSKKQSATNAKKNKKATKKEKEEKDCIFLLAEMVISR